jgi:hypothetical protein
MNLDYGHKKRPPLEMQKVVTDTYKLLFSNPMNQHKEIKLVFHS